MLKIGSTVYRIQHDRHHEKVFLTVWRDRVLIYHGVHILRRSKDGADFFIYRGQPFYVSEFTTPRGSYPLHIPDGCGYHENPLYV